LARTYVPVPTFRPTRLTSDSAQLFVRLAVVKAGTFILLFLPFLPPLAPISAILDPITRISPSKGGIFEDKGQLVVCEQRSREMEALGFAELTYADICPSHPCRFLGLSHRSDTCVAKAEK
jgi:hypothetical protein